MVVAAGSASFDGRVSSKETLSCFTLIFSLIFTFSSFLPLPNSFSIRAEVASSTIVFIPCATSTPLFCRNSIRLACPTFNCRAIPLNLIFFSFAILYISSLFSAYNKAALARATLKGTHLPLSLSRHSCGELTPYLV